MTMKTDIDLEDLEFTADKDNSKAMLSSLNVSRQLAGADPCSPDTKDLTSAPTSLVRRRAP